MLFSVIIIELAYGKMEWSFRGGTRGNAVPIVKIPLERMGTAFPLLSYGENAWERCCIVTKLHNTFYFSPITPIHNTVDSPMAMAVHAWIKNR